MTTIENTTEVAPGLATTTNFRERLDAALRTTQAATQRVQAKAVATAKATDQCIREHPYQTLGVFFGLGLLIGRWLRNR